MPVLRRFAFGKVTSVLKADGSPYEDDAWRLSYVEKPGLILFYESFNLHPGQYFLYLYPYCDDHLQTYFHSSCGNLSIAGNSYTLKTQNSIYKAAEDPLCLSAYEKMDVMLNSGTISYRESISDVAEFDSGDKSKSMYAIYLRNMTRNLPDDLLAAIMSLRQSREVQKVSEEIDRALDNGQISPDQARYLNNKYVNFERIGRDYYV